LIDCMYSTWMFQYADPMYFQEGRCTYYLKFSIVVIVLNFSKTNISSEVY
jgi:hypothetical protein